MTENSWYISVWKNKSYLDLWSMNHFLAGTLLQGMAVFVGTEFWTSLLVAMALMIGWELFEIIDHIKETIGNRLTDFFLGVAGFLSLHYLYTSWLSYTGFLIVFTIIAIVWIILELWGFFAYRSAKDHGQV